MKWHEQREAFYKEAVQQGFSRLEQLAQVFPLGYNVPQAKIEKWLGKLLEVPRDFCGQPRYVNRFKLGADPEFVFMAGGQRADATAFGFKQGLAYGADNNGRLAEIRPFPARSALDVVASILATLKWIAMLHPKTLGYDWCAGAYLQDDGLGGHVHFGRKRPTRDAEVAALDSMEEELLALGVYPAAEVNARRGGDAHRQIYGRLGDFRLQAHGYEYRTFPSWLDSPELAFLTLVVSKLAVHNPSFLVHYKIKGVKPEIRLRRVMNLLSYYKDVDDDARLALIMLTRKLPIHAGGDFKGRWGIGPLVGLEPCKVAVVPRAIRPSAFLVEELFQHFLAETPLTNKAPEVTWQPSTLPGSYSMMLNEVATRGAKGLGEVIWDMATCAKRPLYLSYHNGGPYCMIPRSVEKLMPKNWRQHTGLTGEVRVQSDDDTRIYVNEQILSKEPGALRRFLLNGMMPIWKAGDVKAESFDQWRAHVEVKPAQPEYEGSVLFASEHIPGVK